MIAYVIRRLLSTFVVMAVVLLVRPSGLFGEAGLME